MSTIWKNVLTDKGKIPIYSGGGAESRIQPLVAYNAGWPTEAYEIRYTLANNNYITVTLTQSGSNFSRVVRFYYENNTSAGQYITSGSRASGFLALYTGDQGETFKMWNSQGYTENQYEIIQAGPAPASIALVKVDNTPIYGNLPGYAYWEGAIVNPSTDPFDPGGTSEPGGGDGTFDDESEPIDFPDLPELSAASTGFITLFNPTLTELTALATYMWTNSLFDLDTWKKIFADPMDAILGLTIVPVDVPAAGQRAVTVGNISTGVSMTAAATQYVELDCGTLTVEEYWGAYLDYDPFTKAEIYLPYIGTHAIAVDDIMGKDVHVKYHIDILSGACAAFIKCGESVLYTFVGQCASSIPITGSDMTNVINGIITAAASIGSMVATGGASAPVAVPALASTAVNDMKPTIEKSGGMAGTGGMLGIQTPYLILSRPNQCVPNAQNEYMGYPSFITSSLGSLSGYTEVETVHLSGLSCTDEELAEAESLLKSGVIL